MVAGWLWQSITQNMAIRIVINERHRMTSSPQKHGRPAETEPANVIPTHRPITRQAKPIQGPKLYSKVLTIEPNRLL